MAVGTISLLAVASAVPAFGASPPQPRATFASSDRRCSGRVLPLTLPGGTPTDAYAVGTDPAGQACLISKVNKTGTIWRDVPVPSGFSPHMLTGTIVYNGEGRALVHVGQGWKEVDVPGDQGDPNGAGWGYYAAAGSVVVGYESTESPTYDGPIEAQYNSRSGKLSYLNIPAIIEMAWVYGLTDNWAVGQTSDGEAGGVHWNATKHKWTTVTFAKEGMLSATNGRWMGGESATSGVIYNWNNGHPVRYSVPAGVADVTAVTDSWAIGTSASGRHYSLLHYHAGVWSQGTGPALNQYTQLWGNVMTGYNPGSGKGGTVWNATVVGGQWHVDATMTVSRAPAPLP
jgi:hypothetical protein